MGTYVKELYPITGAKGERVMSLLIEKPFKELSVYYEVYRQDNTWVLYWNYEVPPEEFLPKLAKFKGRATYYDICTEIAKLSKTYSSELGLDDINRIHDFVNKGLPIIKGPIPRGFDGGNYIVTFGNSTKEYYSWCVIPKEWYQLQEIVEILNNVKDSYEY